MVSAALTNNRKQLREGEATTRGGIVKLRECLFKQREGLESSVHTVWRNLRSASQMGHYQLSNSHREAKNYFSKINSEHFFLSLIVADNIRMSVS